MPAKITVPGTTVALLSDNSKMPGKSWNLPAGVSCHYQSFGENSICRHCYAKRGHFRIGPKVVAANQARLNWTSESMQTAHGENEWVKVMTDALYAIYQASDSTVFIRGHGAGDFFSEEYAESWGRVCSLLPNIRFWFPSHAWREETDGWMIGALEYLAELPNVALRPSALYIGDPPPVVPGWAAGTSVTKNRAEVNCPAHLMGNKCANCRYCWEKSGEITYPLT